MIPVQRWPATLDAGARLHLLAVETPDTPLRETARGQIRAALLEALAQILERPASSLSLRSAPGEAPRLILPDGKASLSISHEAGLSLAAIHLDGAVGVDLMRIIELPDQPVLARDYLGPDAAARLAALPAREQASAFAEAWCAHEAKLKCLGLGLQEWNPELARRLSACIAEPLALPEGWAGAVATLE
jgi:4'-phosphopantetheinyl transferase